MRIGTFVLYKYLQGKGLYLRVIWRAMGKTYLVCSEKVCVTPFKFAKVFYLECHCPTRSIQPKEREN